MDVENKNIDSLKELVTLIAEVSLLINEVSQGFSFEEVNMIIDCVNQLKKVIEDAPFLADEYFAMSANDRIELIDFVNQKIEFPANVEVEKIIEKILNVGISLSVLFSMLRK